MPAELYRVAHVTSRGTLYCQLRLLLTSPFASVPKVPFSGQ